MYLRIVCAALGILFGGGCGFALGGIISLVVVCVGLAVITRSDSRAMIDAAFAAHPWGAEAIFIVCGEWAGAGLGAWFAVRLSQKMLAELPSQQPTLVRSPSALRARSKVAFGWFLVVLPILSALTLPDKIRLALHSATATGQVVQLFPQEHGTISYDYMVNGRLLQARGSPEKLDGLSPGMGVRVYYLPDRPEVSVLHEPRGELLHAVPNVIITSVFASIWLMAVFTTAQRPRLTLPKAW